MDFVKNILNFIKSNGYTEKQICEILEKNPSYLSDWKSKKSKPKVEDIIILAELFDISVDRLLGRDMPKQNKSEAKSNLTPIEGNLLLIFRELNPEGQDAALAMLSGLAAQPIYKKSAPDISTKQAQ